MKLKSSTVLLLLVAAVFASGVYFWDQRRPPQSESGEQGAENKPLFQFKEADIAKVGVQYQGQTLKFEKTAQGWQIQTPQPGAAEEGTVTFLLNQLATGTSSRTLAIQADQLREFGLDKPTATIDVTLKDQKTHQLVLGKQTFDQSSIYARVDPGQAPPNSIVVVPTAFLDAVSRPLSEWQAKPKPTSTPSPQPQAAPTDKAPPSSPSPAPPSP